MNSNPVKEVSAKVVSKVTDSLRNAGFVDFEVEVFPTFTFSTKRLFDAFFTVSTGDGKEVFRMSGDLFAKSADETAKAFTKKFLNKRRARF